MKETVGRIKLYPREPHLELLLRHIQELEQKVSRHGKDMDMLRERLGRVLTAQLRNHGNKNTGKGRKLMPGKTSVNYKSSGGSSKGKEKKQGGKSFTQDFAEGAKALSPKELKKRKNQGLKDME